MAQNIKAPLSQLSFSCDFSKDLEEIIFTTKTDLILKKSGRETKLHVCFPQLLIYAISIFNTAPVLKVTVDWEKKKVGMIITDFYLDNQRISDLRVHFCLKREVEDLSRPQGNDPEEQRT